MELYNLEAEQIIIGTIIQNNQYLLSVDFIDEKHFYFEENKIIWREIIKVISSGSVANQIILKNLFVNNKTLINAGGLEYLKSLQLAAQAIIGIREYAKLIVELWRKRELELILKCALNDIGSDFDDIKTKIDEDIAELNFEVSSEPKKISDLVEKLIEESRKKERDLLYFGFRKTITRFAGFTISCHCH